MSADANGMANGMDRRLQAEIVNLIHYIDRLRKEIAGIARTDNSQATFVAMSDRLDAIVDSTAEATNTILSATEDIDGFVEALRAYPAPDEIDALCDRIGEKTMLCMEACSFQDLTGQRISKVIASLKFVEERVNAMADICGRQEIDCIAQDLPTLPQQIDDGIALDGPQNAGDAISQDDIDALFS